MSSRLMADGDWQKAAVIAGGHKGIAIGVRVPQKENIKVRDMTYDREVHVTGNNGWNASITALHILSQKQEAWRHEKEVRIFSRSEFVDINLVRIVFGCQIRDPDRELVRGLVRKLCPEVRTTTMKRDQLDSPDW